MVKISKSKEDEIKNDRRLALYARRVKLRIRQHKHIEAHRFFKEMWEQQYDRRNDELLHRMLYEQSMIQEIKKQLDGII